MTPSPIYFALPFLLFSYSAAFADISEAANLIQRDLSFSVKGELNSGAKIQTEVTAKFDVSSCSLRISEHKSVDGEVSSLETTVIPISDIDIDRLDHAPSFLASINPESGGGVFFHSLGRRFTQDKTGYGIPPDLHSAVIQSAMYEECFDEICRSSEQVWFAFLWPSHDLGPAKAAIAELSSNCSAE